MNIELISEKSAEYWENAIVEVKRDYPESVVIASVMCGYSKEDWQELAGRAAKTGADALELNLSCPHGMGEKGMGLACGQNPDMVRDICGWVKEVSYDNDGKVVPVFAKLTPNVTEVVHIATAAKEGGADGVTAINTVSGLFNVTADAVAWPAVGNEKKTTYGGLSGNIVRPMALRAVSAVSKALPGYPILATGGCDSADTALQFLYAGASAVQISSAVQNQDYTVINDYTTGLKALFYKLSRSDLDDWTGLRAPTPKNQAGKELLVPVKLSDDTVLPPFGDFERSRQRLQAEITEKDVVGIPFEEYRPAVTPDRPLPSVQDLVGRAVPKIGAWYELAPVGEEQVVAVIDPDLCINCGKCYMTCNDTGYQAIDFDEATHVPEVNSDCTGCTLCHSVCPVIDCIEMVPREGKYEPHRGIPFKEASA
jgi:dihydropyrimidine dehydrogenase (NADP+)